MPVRFSGDGCVSWTTIPGIVDCKGGFGFYRNLPGKAFWRLLAAPVGLGLKERLDFDPLNPGAVKPWTTVNNEQYPGGVIAGISHVGGHIWSPFGAALFTRGSSGGYH